MGAFRSFEATARVSARLFATSRAKYILPLNSYLESPSKRNRNAWVCVMLTALWLFDRWNSLDVSVQNATPVKLTGCEWDACKIEMFSARKFESTPVGATHSCWRRRCLRFAKWILRPWVHTCTYTIWNWRPGLEVLCGNAWLVLTADTLYPTDSVYKVILQDLIPAQIRQLILYISNSKRQVNEFWWELTFAKRLCKHFVWNKLCQTPGGISGPGAAAGAHAPWGSSPDQSVFRVVLLKSAPPQIRRIFVYYYWSKYKVDGFVGDLTF